MKLHPKYSEDLDTSRPLPHSEYESFCRAVARAESATDAYRTYIEPNCPIARARRCGSALWRKWWIRARVRGIEAELQAQASARAPLLKDDVLATICKKFSKVAEQEASTMKESAEQARALVQYGDMICRLTGAFAQKPVKNEVSVKVQDKPVDEEEGA